MTDFSHMDAIIQRLARETARLNAATNENERAFRQLQISQNKKELASEKKFLGISELTLEETTMSDDELLAEVGV